MYRRFSRGDSSPVASPNKRNSTIVAGEEQRNTIMDKQFGTVNEKLDRIEEALKELKASGVSVAGTNGAAAGGGGEHIGRRGKVTMMEDAGDSGSGVMVPAPPAEGEKPKRRGVKIADDGSNSPSSSSIDPPKKDNYRRSSMYGGGVSPSNKARVAHAKKKRSEFFDDQVFEGPWTDVPKSKTVQCVWLGCAALAFSYVSGEKVTIEDILRNNEMAMHYVTFPSVTLAELADNMEEYCTTADSLKDLGVRTEVATFDASTVEDAGDELGTGERLPIMNLASFRRELNECNGDENSIHIFNYDPFIVQEFEIKDDFDESSDEEEASMITSPKIKKKAQWSQKNMGHFAILIHFNPALHTVTLGTPHLDDDGKFHIETHQCSVQTLFKATAAKDGYSKRARGFVRVFKQTMGAQFSPVPSIFPMKLVDGRSANGMLSIALDVAIAPHILGLAITHHIVAQTIIKGEGVSSGSNLRGIPVTDLCNELNLPVQMITGRSTGMRAVEMCYAWYKRFLTSRGLQNQVVVGVNPITRKGNSEDGMPSMMDEDFFAHIIEAVENKCVMLVNFDVNVAHNVVVEPAGDVSHFAIVVGVEPDRGIVRLADVSVKKYRKMWHVPLVRLYNAIIGYGYVIVGPQEAAEVVNKFGCGTKGDALVQRARNTLPPSVPNRMRTAFEYPRKNYNVTILAKALNIIGFNEVSVEDLVYSSGFHNSFLLSEHIPMRDQYRVLTYFVATRLNGQVECDIKHIEDAEDTEAALEARIKAAAASEDEVLMVNFSNITIQGDSLVWNGSNGGPLAIVSGYDATERTVTLSDSNPEAFYRTWNCPISKLYEACTQPDKYSGRNRGWISVKKAAAGTTELSPVDMRESMVHHPFKAPVSSQASAIAVAVSHLIKRAVSLEDVIFSSLTFNLSLLSQGSDDIEKTVEMANNFIKAQKLDDSITVTQGDVKIVGSAGASAGELQLTLYKSSTGAVNAGIVTSVKDGNITILDGNQTRNGSWTESVEKFQARCTGVIVFSQKK